MNKPFSGKVAVVSGGSKGIGCAIARRLSSDGADIMLLASNGNRLQSAAAGMSADTGGRVEYFTRDLRTLEGCEESVAAVKSIYGRCDILVNSAGATKGGKFTAQPDEEWIDGLALKLFSAVRLSRSLWPLLTDAKGTVLNIVGGWARTPEPDFMVGGIANASLASFTKALARQGNRDDVNVNGIYPGATRTERMRGIMETRAEVENRSFEDIEGSMIEREQIRRLGEPEDVAALAAFLCSPEARHIQGTAIAVDGGATQGLF